MKGLICGVGGQDGAYLAQYLLTLGYEVVGTSRDASTAPLSGLAKLGLSKEICLESMAVTDFRSVLQTLKRHKPDEIYNLAGQSSVGLSFEQPVETIESIAFGTLNLLESMRFLDDGTKLYQAGSSECFGNSEGTPASENTPFVPRSPYAVAKTTAHNLVANYREAYGLFACTGILFNHESPLRPSRFVTRKIVAAASRIASGNLEKLVVGNTAIQRDWGWAPEYVVAMWRMLQNPIPKDFVIATGRTVSLEYFIERVFSYFSLDYREHMVVDERLFRPTDLDISRANPELAWLELKWRAQFDVDEVVRNLCQFEEDNKNGKS